MARARRYDRSRGVRHHHAADGRSRAVRGGESRARGRSLPLDQRVHRRRNAAAHRHYAAAAISAQALDSERAAGRGARCVAAGVGPRKLGRLPMAEAEGVVVVRGGAQGFVQEITAGRHRLVADEPVAAGGTDRGPGPYDLLMAALGACMSMTIALYARTKKGPLETVVVRLTHSRV